MQKTTLNSTLPRKRGALKLLLNGGAATLVHRNWGHKFSHRPLGTIANKTGEKGTPEHCKHTQNFTTYVRLWGTTRVPSTCQPLQAASVDLKIRFPLFDLQDRESQPATEKSSFWSHDFRTR